jgi:hypothetical protein
MKPYPKAAAFYTDGPGGFFLATMSLPQHKSLETMQIIRSVVAVGET